MSLNLLDAEALIIARLKLQLAGVAGLSVASAASIAGLLPQDVTKLLPALFTVPGAAEVPSHSSDGLAQAQDETWTVVAAVKLLPDATLAQTFAAAGDLLGQAAQALAGWAPSASYRPMKYLGREEPDFSAGYVEFALRFSVRRLFTGTGG